MKVISKIKRDMDIIYYKDHTYPSAYPSVFHEVRQIYLPNRKAR
jgi:hypothetical protein